MAKPNNGNGNGKHQTIDQNGETVRIEGHLKATSLNDACEGFKDTYNNLLSGVMTHHQAHEANRALSGIVQTRKIQMDFALKTKMSQERIEKLANEFVGLGEMTGNRFVDRSGE
jgi:hypothetical protein